MAREAALTDSSNQAAPKRRLEAGLQSMPESEGVSVQQQQQKGSSGYGMHQKQAHAGAGNSSRDCIMLDAEAVDNNGTCKRAEPSGAAAAPTGQPVSCLSVCWGSGQPCQRAPACTC